MIGPLGQKCSLADLDVGSLSQGWDQCPEVFKSIFNGTFSFKLGS